MTRTLCEFALQAAYPRAIIYLSNRNMKDLCTSTVAAPFIYTQLFLFFKKIIYWSIVDLQWCVNFCSTVKWFSYTYILFWAPLIAQLVKNLPAMQETLVQFLDQEAPPEKGKISHSSSWASLVAQTVKNPPAKWRPGFDPWVGKFPWRRERLPTPVFLPGESHGQRSLEGYSPWGHKVRHNWAQYSFSSWFNHRILNIVPFATQ